MMDPVSGRSGVSLLPQYLICCPASCDLLTAERFISHFMPHTLPRQPPSFSSRSPPPHLRPRDCLSSVPALDAFAWLTSLFVAAFDLVLHCVVPPAPFPPPSLQVTAVLPLESRLCCTTYGCAALFAQIFLLSGCWTHFV